jgi:hypothetical protein
MARGGCQVTTATSRIDARLETRLGAILSELLGTERELGGRAAGSRHEREALANRPRPKQWAKMLGKRASAWPTRARSSSRER